MTNAKQPQRESWSPWLLPVGYLAVALAAAIVWAWQGRLILADDLETPLGTMLLGILCNASCAILGCYLVLRRMSLLGDAISHAVLPGLALAFLFTGQVFGLPILLGAMALGICTSFLTQTLQSLGRVSEDASMGVVFTSLFAAGVIMLQSWAGRAHLDADCMLYGLMELAWGERVSLWGWEIPRALLSLVPALLLTLFFVTLFWKELKIVSFDPALAAAMGIRVAVVHYLLMAMVAGVTVAAFESVGSILVVAMLIVPAAAAGLMTNRLARMLVWAVIFGAVAAIFGYLGAAALNTNVAGMTAVAAGVQFAGAVFLAPKQGLVSRWLANFSLRVRIESEDVIGRLYRAEEARGRGAAAETLRVGWLAWVYLARRQLVAGWGRRLALTERGRAAAQNLVRAHRLWESYLEKHFSLPTDHLHEPAERMEHFLDPALQAEIAAELAGRAVDPHGREIPPQPGA